MPSLLTRIFFSMFFGTLIGVSAGFLFFWMIGLPVAEINRHTMSEKSQNRWTGSIPAYVGLAASLFAMIVLFIENPTP